MPWLANFNFLFPMIRRELPSYALGALLVCLTSLCQVAIPWLVGKVIACLESGIRIDMVPDLALAMVAAVLMRALTAYWMRMIMIGASRRIEFKLRNSLFRHIEDLDASFFTRTHTGDLMNRFTSDMEAVRSVLGPGIMYTLNTFATLSLALAAMMSVSVPLTFYALLPLGFITIVVRVLGPRVHKESLRAQEMLSDISVHAQENFANAKVIKSFVREDGEVARMLALSERYHQQNMRLARLRSILTAVLWLIGDLVIMALLAVGGYQLIEGKILLGEFAAFNGCLLLLIWPMTALGWVMNIFQRGAASAHRLQQLIEARPAVHDGAADPALAVRRGELAMRDLHFAYEGAPPVLKGINIDLPAGRTLGVVGPTGAGKSTLLKLIPRLHPAAEGSVLIDGASIEKIPLAQLRDGVGYVPQDPFLFSATVEENIGFSTDDPSPEEVRAVAELARIDEEIARFPDAYQQRVGERGITLSGGQKQRIALARALLKNPKILLLDDVLSAVDAKTESEILAALKRRTKDLTTIIVTHRLSTVRHADEIVVLTDGRILERGRHEGLIAAGGYYARVWQKQSLERELESL